jgi:hypothetical protein
MAKNKMKLVNPEDKEQFCERLGSVKLTIYGSSATKIEIDENLDAIDLMDMATAFINFANNAFSKWYKENRKQKAIVDCEECRKCGETTCGGDTKDHRCFERK